MQNLEASLSVGALKLPLPHKTNFIDILEWLRKVDGFYKSFLSKFQIYKDIKLRQSRRRQSMSQVGCNKKTNNLKQTEKINFYFSSLQTTINHQARRRQEDNLAVVFMGIVGVFLLCHFLRVFLNLHEMVVIRDAMACTKAGQQGFPVWALVMTSFR